MPTHDAPYDAHHMGVSINSSDRPLFVAILALKDTWTCSATQLHGVLSIYRNILWCRGTLAELQ